jgi:hypothetical protein
MLGKGIVIQSFLSACQQFSDGIINSVIPDSPQHTAGDKAEIEGARKIFNSKCSYEIFYFNKKGRQKSLPALKSSEN